MSVCKLYDTFSSLLIENKLPQLIGMKEKPKISNTSMENFIKRVLGNIQQRISINLIIRLDFSGQQRINQSNYEATLKR